MRAVVAALLALSLALPARAADAVHQLSLGGALLSTTDQMVAVCDADTVIQYDRGAASPTNAGRKITYGSSWSATTFSGPTPVTATYVRANLLGCQDGKILLGGGSTAGNRWAATTSLDSPGTWDLRIDGTSNGGLFGIASQGLGAEDWTFGFSNSAVNYIGAVNATADPSWGEGSYALYAVGHDPGYQCSGARGNSDHYGGGCWGGASVEVVGFNGTTTIYSRDVGPAYCDNFASGTPLARQSFGYVTSGSNSNVFHVGYNGTDSRVCAFVWTGSAVFGVANQLFSGLVIVGGAYFAGSDRVWSAGGTAYVGGGGATTTFFSDESGSTYDLPCASGVLTGVVQDVDVDRDADAADNLLGLCSSGDLIYYGEELPVVAGSSARPRPVSLHGSLGGSLRGAL